MQTKQKQHSLNWLARLDAHHRLWISLAFTAISVILLYITGLPWASLSLAGWDIFALITVLLSWAVFYITEPMQIRKKVQGLDSSPSLVFILVIIASFSSMLAVTLLLNNTNSDAISKDLHTPISIVAVILSWFLVHTVFTFRYAHLFYSDHEDTPSRHAGGLDFPSKGNPDYIDFAYFSFVIGMTFQVSDVVIISHRLRHQVLLHSILSFAFNTFIVALVINVIAGLGK